MTTIIPWWREGPYDQPAVARRTVRVPAGTWQEVARAAAGWGVRPRSVVAAAYLRLVALLAGESEVAIGFVGTPGPDVPGRIGTLRVTIPRTWPELARAVDDAVPAGLAEPAPGVPPESVFATGDADLPAAAAAVGAPLWVHLRTGAGPWRLQLRHRTDRIDAGYAGRIGGYLSRALVAAARGTAPVDEADLVPPDEHHRQVRLGTGPHRELPDRRPHELFAALAHARPDRVALRHRDRHYSYAELNRAANRVAYALLDRDLRVEEPVAVIAERGFDWAAAIIGVLKAGGVYLPVEPDAPPARTERMLAQSRCRLALVLAPGRGSEPARAGHHLPAGLHVLDLAGLPPVADPDRDPPTAIGAERLAYIYFTSGSTGQPKGAMCEHLGMLNHLRAKIDDLRLGADDVVVQSAQASFDISLWQVLAPLLVGGSALVVDRETTTDVDRFLAELVDHGATVLQVVPSYLEILLHHLESRPRDLGRLRWLSVTGEAVPRALVARWLDRYPGIGLVNAYGATEASDDTTHEPLFAAPPGDLVPVGWPVGNVTVYILEPARDRLVPLGSTGEIAFSGVCVGRGYVNDPERTCEAFHPDPFRPGTRMYRTGDFGRWLPTGSIEFHGRRDEQLKVSGHRIETGEVENCLLECPGVRSARVVATEVTGAGKRLTAFYTGDVDRDRLARWTAARLMAAAVPARFQRLETMPLNSNGKIDVRALAARAEALTDALTDALVDAAGPDGRQDRAGWSDTQWRIARAWAQALAVPVDRISADDDFFSLGGTSLAALRVVASLDGTLSLPDLMLTPTLRELAARVEGTGPA